MAGGAEHVLPFERMAGTDKQKVGSRLLPAEDLHVKPGDVIAYYARARDVPHGKPSSMATSDMLLPRGQAVQRGVRRGREPGQRRRDPQIEGLIDAQKQIITSTWNVERRSQGGRSSDDVKAIAAAQAELKARAEQQLAPSRHPDRARRARAGNRGPAGQTRRGGRSPAKAVEAMGNALQQLGAERTKDALSHEMAALNGLLQAQAEMRRRQVTRRRTAPGAAFGNRNEQDLSALFDKELQRDQRTNYENRPSVETARRTRQGQRARPHPGSGQAAGGSQPAAARYLAQSNVSAEERNVNWRS